MSVLLCVFVVICLYCLLLGGLLAAGDDFRF